MTLPTAVLPLVAEGSALGDKRHVRAIAKLYGDFRDQAVLT